MFKKLIKFGNSWGLIIPAALLELLKLNPVLDEVEILFENDSIIIKKRKK